MDAIDDKRFWEILQEALDHLQIYAECLRDNLCEGREQAATLVGEIEEARRKITRLEAEQRRGTGTRDTR